MPLGRGPARGSARPVARPTPLAWHPAARRRRVPPSPRPVAGAGSRVTVKPPVSGAGINGAGLLGAKAAKNPIYEKSNQ